MKEFPYPKWVDEQLGMACYHRDINKLNDLRNQGIDFTHTFRDFDDALSNADYAQDYTIPKYLIDHGLNPYYYQFRKVHYQISSEADLQEQEEIQTFKELGYEHYFPSQFLLDQGAGINHIMHLELGGDLQRTPLDTAIHLEHKYITRHLEGKNAKRFEELLEGERILHYDLESVCDRFGFSEIKFYIHNKPSLIDLDLFQALLYLIQVYPKETNLEVIEFVLKALKYQISPFDICLENLSQYARFSPLLLKISSFNLTRADIRIYCDLIELLFEYGDNPLAIKTNDWNYKWSNKNAVSILDIAKKLKSPIIIDLLKKYGAKTAEEILNPLL